MNLRQKAKHYKKLYEKLRYDYPSKLPPTTVVPIVTLKARQTVHESVINDTLSAELEPPYVIAGKVVMQDLAKELMKHSKIEVKPSIIPEHVELEASVEVLESSSGIR